MSKPLINKCTKEHKVGLNHKTWTYTLPDYIEDDGECYDGCCDDFKCKECGYKFRIECPQ